MMGKMQGEKLRISMECGGSMCSASVRVKVIEHGIYINLINYDYAYNINKHNII